ncbi:MAG: tRNA (adenosine(37)-N6)-dimethylallyltransferase MiaA [Tangfeifania sp.]
MSKHLIVIAGPTGIGKTSAGINIARHFNTEIVSSDSRQLYKELKIGTAVPSTEELSAVKHHFIHSHSIFDNYNASQYEKEAISLLRQLYKKHDIVLMVGGSMLYIDAVCRGIDQMPDADPELRKNLKNQLETEGLENLRKQLKKLDPKYYSEVDLKNPARIVHALEISLMTGKPYSSFRSNPQKQRPFSIHKITLDCDRQELHRRINQRVDKMVATGLEEEARRYYNQKHLNALNTVGYREFFAYFDGEISKEKAIELIKRNSRRYARKQLTWFRKDTATNWFGSNQTDEIISFIENKTAENEQPG